MPKEQIRKRGRRKPKNEEEHALVSAKVEAPAPTATAVPIPEQQAQQAGPSGLHPDRLALLAGHGSRPSRPRVFDHGQPLAQRPVDGVGAGAEGGVTEGQGAAEGDQPQGPWGRTFGLNEEFPFGELDPDTKGYFKGLDDKIKHWLETGSGTVTVGEEREDRQNDLKDTLDSLRGKELKISTDPDTSITLERLLPSLGDWGRRVVGDSFGTQWELLLKNRFGSHIVQTWLTLAADTLDRESRGIFPPQQEEQNEEEGVLPKMSELIKGLVASIEANLAFMLANPFASPVLRLLWLVLTPGRSLPGLEDGEGDERIRSKRSNKYRKGQGVGGKTIFGESAVEGEGKGKGKETEGRRLDKELVGLREKMRKGLMEKLSGAEWRMLGVNPVGCVTVQLLLEFEVEDGDSETENSLLDHLTEGLVTCQLKALPYEPQPYPISLLTSSTGTRLFESLLLSPPIPIFQKIWSTYFEGKIGKLAIHPMSNFVVAKGVERLDKEGVERVVGECKAVSGGRQMIKSARTSVLQALVERVSKLGDCQLSVLSLIQSAIALPEDQPTNLVPCLMTLNTYPRYTSILSGEEVEEEPEADLPPDAIDQKAEDEAAAAAKIHAWENRRKVKPAEGGVGLEPKIQGCLLLQALAQCPVANEVVLQSLIDQPVATLITYATHPIASRLLDVTLTTTSSGPKYRRRLITTLLPHLEDLLSDKIGSRISEKIWESADGFTKEKIAKSLLSSSESIRRSQYGRYLWPRMKLDVMQRRPDVWRAEALGVVHHFAHQKAPATTNATAQQEQEERAEQEREEAEEERKRKKDDIDELFEGVQDRKKSKKSKSREYSK